ncbi:hypothetical protein CHGG_02437 [Chaetomium globosum CBS 148.51]|uniref:Reverse transcriptase domain-containing protein n=1 Tax=Chaetomium globosum (strain ATCC 6205 / CBS 148.51 / DSM 1962 / NBRC 6347 / NRRL 1970) TaxID=306901 RepID=Q2HBG7_CHAGB|nr:uncharacterized protein CHGG_02437 [Chaetomium globosum CBS 148.51]EAQ90502.1 hypothetical protein CHGG_02437 [Chaetomium globosum CBS 148.51]
MASTEVLSQTLSSITAIKLDQLQQQKEAYGNKKRSLLEEVASESDTAVRAKKLLKGCKDLQSLGLKRNRALSSLGEFLDQAKYDPSITEPFLKEYEAEISQHMDAQTNKYEFASLYGKLVEEWIASGNSDAASTAEGSNFVVVGREEMHEQRATWEEYVFKAKDTDPKAIKTYLGDVFSSKEAKRYLGIVRKTLERFQKDWKSMRHFDVDTLDTVIQGMLRSDILTEEKRTTLRDFKANKVILSEIADVLNMRLSTMATWSWGTPLIVDQRRNINGRYRFYTDEDLLHSILVYYVGLRWAVQLREALTTFTKGDGVWKSDTKPISKDDARRHRFFLDDYLVLNSSSVQKLRDIHFHSILLDQLPRSFDEVRDTYAGSGDKAGDTKPSPVTVVQELLQRLQAEIIMQTKLGKDVTVIRSDFKWFGPSIPHSTIYAVLEFFGVQSEWIDFFRRVLEAEIRFKQDSPDAPVQIRKRGTPMSTPITDLFGESILFCLDYAVNQKAAGTRLYRLHDDMWLWGNSGTCADAWKVITQFTDTMGLELNSEKTGSVQVKSDNGTAASTTSSGTLPEGDVKWGFLKLDPATGRFLINQDEVDKHIDELRLQLSACRSILDYIQAWNIYGHRFFANNFGKPANCYGRAHIDSMLATFRRIQDKLFPDHPGGVGEHLKLTIASRFNIPPSHIPDGYLYWPSSHGGLGLKNPFISLLLFRRQVEKDPAKLMTKYLSEEEFVYARAKARFEAGFSIPALQDNDDASDMSDDDSDDDDDDDTSVVTSDNGDDDDASMVMSDNNDDDASVVVKSDRPGTNRWGASSWRDGPEWADLRDQPFMSAAEFARYRELTDARLGRLYRQLMAAPEVKALGPTGEVKAALPDMPTWSALGEYEQWVVQLYHKDIVARFGGVDVVDQGLLPTGLMSMLRESRFRWQG